MINANKPTWVLFDNGRDARPNAKEVFKNPYGKILYLESEWSVNINDRKHLPSMSDVVLCFSKTCYDIYKKQYPLKQIDRIFPSIRKKIFYPEEKEIIYDFSMCNNNYGHDDRTAPSISVAIYLATHGKKVIYRGQNWEPYADIYSHWIISSWKNDYPDGIRNTYNSSRFGLIFTQDLKEDYATHSIFDVCACGKLPVVWCGNRYYREMFPNLLYIRNPEEALLLSSLSEKEYIERNEELSAYMTKNFNHLQVLERCLGHIFFPNIISL
ncbi:MAG: hypothetical protein WC375_11485 [Methanomassiliicoccales archaeon]